MKRAREDPPQLVAQRVTIDVGGTKFVTTFATIRHSSFLAGMVDLGRADDKPDDKPLELFLDRDPDIFAKLLRLMRHMPGVVGLMPKEPFTCASLLAEADFLGVDALLQHVKVKAYYNSRRAVEDMPAVPENVTRDDEETFEDFRQRQREAFSAHRKERNRIQRAFRKQDEVYAVQRFAAVYGSVSDALENDVLPKYFLEPKPLIPLPVKRIVQLLPVEATTWFLVGDIFDTRYGAPHNFLIATPEDGQYEMMRMVDALQRPGSARRVACHALTEDNNGNRSMEPVIYLSAADYEAWFQSSDVEPAEANGPLIYGTTLEDGQLMEKYTGGLAHRTMLASDWLNKALLERKGYFGVILPQHYWTHILVADTPPKELGFSRMDPDAPHHQGFESYEHSDYSDDE
mmetsp:Transcript_33787/g.88921  ORF Transcript_33787/g.88921 Transcript_33787/m.88921 type:complete len:402 (-) Transcript_33787:584-1789(-)